MFYCFQGKGSGALLFSRERNRCCSQGEENWCTTVLKEKETGAILLMFQEKGTGALLFSDKGRLGCSTFKNESGAGCCTKFTG